MTTKNQSIRKKFKVFRTLILTALGIILLAALSLFVVRIEDRVYANGKVGAVTEYELSSLAGSKISKVLKEEGEFVGKGETILELDPKKHLDEIQSLRLELKELEAEYKVKSDERAILLKEPLPSEFRHSGIKLTETDETLKKNIERMERYKSLFEKKVISKSEYEKVELEYFQSKADYERAKDNHQKVKSGLSDQIITKSESELQLLKTKIENKKDRLKMLESHIDDFKVVAPEDSKVVFLPHKPGLYLERGAMAARLAAVDRKKLIAYVDERDISKVKIGQKARISSSVYNRLQFGYFKGEIIRIRDLPVKEAGLQKYPVEVLIEDEEYSLKLGSSAEVEIITGKDIIIKVLLGLSAETRVKPKQTL